MVSSLPSKYGLDEKDEAGYKFLPGSRKSKENPNGGGGNPFRSFLETITETEREESAFYEVKESVDS